MEENWEAQCQSQTERILALRGWTLVQDVKQFARDVSQETRRRFNHKKPFEKQVEQAVVNRYCIVLYEACAGTDRERQHRAFEELARHLDSVAYYRGQPLGLVPELRQRALLKIWKNLETIRDKESFFDWCNRILLNEITEYFRVHDAQDFDLSSLIDEEESEEQVEATVSGLRGEEQRFQDSERDEMHQEVTAALLACLENETQRLIIIELFLNDKNLFQVATQLNLTPNHISVLKFRALKALRECNDFNRLYQDWLS